MSTPSSLDKVIEKFSQHKTKAMRRLITRTTKENLWLYVLTLLVERDYFAYELRGAIRDRFGVKIAAVTAYVLLYKLQREGLVELSAERREGKRPTRKYYSITNLGHEALIDAKQYLQILTATLAPSSI
ncbi:MAG: PadR family transcriptional regulator [Promethearchaeota archaeon]